jgi:hypothetical protein
VLRLSGAEAAKRNRSEENMRLRTEYATNPDAMTDEDRARAEMLAVRDERKRLKKQACQVGFALTQNQPDTRASCVFSPQQLSVHGDHDRNSIHSGTCWSGYRPPLPPPLPPSPPPPLPPDASRQQPDCTDPTTTLLGIYPT